MQELIKKEEESTKTLSYGVKFIDSTSWLSSLVNSLSEENHKIKCKYGHNDKKCETCRIKYKYCDCFLKHRNFKDHLIEYY